MFVDKLDIYAKAGNGGDGVVRWLRLQHIAKGGPAGGNGGNGGDVIIEGVRNLGLLSKYTGDNKFIAENGDAGQKFNRDGKGGEDIVIPLPVGSVITNQKTGDVIELTEEGERITILKGGEGGFGNTHFKSSRNRTPMESTPGEPGEEAWYHIELTLSVDVGLIGFPNAGKSTLLNLFTNATSAIGAYPFTTLEPHLGDLYGYILADVPGLIEGAAEGKGLGHKFLQHAQKAKMLLHCVSAEHDDVAAVYTTIRDELKKYDATFLDKEEWVVLTKIDTRTPEEVVVMKEALEKVSGAPVYAISGILEEGTKELRDNLVAELRKNTTV